MSSNNSECNILVIMLDIFVGYFSITLFHIWSTTPVNVFTLLFLLLILFFLLDIFLFRRYNLSKIQKILSIIGILLLIEFTPLPLSYITDFDGGNHQIGESLALGWPAVFLKYYFTGNTIRMIPHNIIVDLVIIFVLAVIAFIYLEAGREINRYKEKS